jgi:hypothetical protein
MHSQPRSRSQSRNSSPFPFGSPALPNGMQLRQTLVLVVVSVLLSDSDSFAGVLRTAWSQCRLARVVLVLV